MHVARTVWMTLELLEQLTDWSVMRNGIWHRYDSLEPEDALVITLHDSSAIGTISFCVLDVVEAFAVRLPDIDLDIVDWLPGCVLDGT